MAERHEGRRQAGVIVPDPETSLISPRRPGPRPPRVWPLWLLLLCLIGAGAAAGHLLWEERQRLESELLRLQGELSNVHARFDAALGEGQALTRLETRLSALEHRDEVHDARLAALEEELDEDRQRHEERADALQQRLTRLAAAATTRETMLAATQVSLDALERSGSEGRAALEDALEAQQARLNVLEEDVTALSSRDDEEELERLEAATDALAERAVAMQEAAVQRQARLVSLEAEVEALAEARDDGRQHDEALASRFSALETEIAELRRAQLALSARLEALGP